MLAIGRALLTNPRLLLMDEPPEDLALGVADWVDVLNKDQEGDSLALSKER